MITPPGDPVSTRLRSPWTNAQVIIGFPGGRFEGNADRKRWRSRYRRRCRCPLCRGDRERVNKREARVAHLSLYEQTETDNVELFECPCDVCGADSDDEWSYYLDWLDVNYEW